MYNEHVAPVADDAGEFSSDDEVGSQAKFAFNNSI